MLRKYCSKFYPIIIVLLSLTATLHAQSLNSNILNTPEPAILEATTRPDIDKVKWLIRKADTAMLTYFNGRDKEDLSVVQQLMMAVESASSKIHYMNGNARCILLKSRLLYIQGKDSLAGELHKQAIQFYNHIDTPDMADAFYFLSESWKFRTHGKEIVPADSVNFQKALDYFRSRKEDKKEASLLRANAYCQIAQGQSLKAIDELINIYRFQTRINDSTRHKTSDLLAHANAITGRFKEAFYWFQQTLKYCEEIKDSVNLCLYNYRAGTINYNVKAFDRGTQYLERALTFAQWQGDTSMCIYLTLVISNDGLVQQNKYEEALKKLVTALNKYSADSNKSYVLNVDIYRCLANCYFHTAQYGLAEKFYLKALYIAEQILNTPESKIPVYNDIAAFYMNQKQFNKAKEYFAKGLMLSELTNSLPAMRDIHFELFKIDSINGDYPSAIRHYQQFKISTDSMFNESKSRQIAELEIQYQTRQKEKDFQLLSNQSALQQKTITQEKYFREALIAGAALLFLLLLVVYSRFRVKKKSNIELKAKQEKINQQNLSLEKLVMDEKRLLTEKDKLLDEKEWLMKEIHHRVKNNLQIIISLLNSQSAYLKDEASFAAIKESQHRIHAISLIHQKLYQSNNLAAVDMEAYIKDVVEYLLDNLDTGQYIKVDVSIMQLQLNVAQAVPLGLIINEAVTNAVKYAFPHERKGLVRIEMCHREKNGVVLTVKDDGIGLPENFNWMNSPTLGISLMKGLSKQLDGKFEIFNNTGLIVQVSFTPSNPVLNNI